MRIVLALLAVTALAAESVTENHPDGSKSFTVQVDKQGQRNGTLTAWWPGGKIVKEKSAWADGHLHGIRQLFDEKGKPLVDETWLQGRLVYPRTQAQTSDGLAAIEREAMAYIATVPKSANPTAAPAADQGKALARLRQYRWLCGLAHDVTIDATYTDEAQEASRILVAIGKLDHHPAKPATWNDTDFAKASNACGHGNLAMGGNSLTAAVDMWMDDSDATNIDRLGHRRWMLNPPMQACGFGITGAYEVIWAHDSARKEPTRQQWQAFPPAGFVPVTHFSDRHAWHLSLNPADYQINLTSETFQIYPLDKRFVRSGPAYALNYEHGNSDGFGSYANARMVRPDPLKQPKGQTPFQVAKGRSYEAVVGGLSPKGDAPKEISWIVTFY